MSEQHGYPAPHIATFQGASAGMAREAASRWLGDFSLHGPLEIRAIKTGECEDVFTAAVFYSKMPLDDEAISAAGQNPSSEVR